jgi:hypothetical protein
LQRGDVLLLVIESHLGNSRLLGFLLPLRKIVQELLFTTTLPKITLLYGGDTLFENI